MIYTCHSLVSRKELGTKLVTVGWVASLLFIADSHRLRVNDGKGNLLPGLTLINVFWTFDCICNSICVYSYTYAIPSGSVQMKLWNFPTHQLIALGNIWLIPAWICFIESLAVSCVNSLQVTGKYQPLVHYAWRVGSAVSSCFGLHRMLILPILCVRYCF